MSDYLVGKLDPRDFEQVARLVLPAPVYGWIASGSDDEQSMTDSISAFRRWRLNPHVMVDVRNVDLSTTVQGTPLAFPVMVAPMGIQKAAHPDGELGTAEGVAATGALFVETLFVWPGVGSLAIQATQQRDYPIIMAVGLLTSLLIIISNLLADIAYAFVDPRIRYS